MKRSLALVSLCALVILSACSREPAPAVNTQVVADDTQSTATAEPPPAEETPAENAPPAEPCDDAPDQRAMTACWGGEMRKAEERVAEALKKLDALMVTKTSVSKTNPAAQQKLQDDQRRWQEFVEGHCGLYGDIYDGGSAGPMTIAVCRWQLAQSRLQQLTDLTEEIDR
jgi:uncharacterized protein YecT (DUF1311 family)